MASFTIIVSSLIALTQDELKRRLAFSTIGQLSYIVLGAALLSPKGLIGGMTHIAMHAFGKITLFFCAGAIFVATGKKNISQMAGIGKRMPLTMAAFFVGALSVIGLPPCGGFISKWYLVLGTLEAHDMALLVVLLVSSLLNAAYFLPIVYRAYFCGPDESNFRARRGGSAFLVRGPAYGNGHRLHHPLFLSGAVSGPRPRGGWLHFREVETWKKKKWCSITNRSRDIGARFIRC